ncbi:MAG: putative membrane protein insertion efficiency factor [candidate division WS2 bacterium]|nr:putative membrane protein insertion efficiency factor [Candidatus Lithacetigena glycinireducens]
MFKQLLVLIIRFYQLTLSPLLGGGKCRFHPNCSEYAIQAINKYGAFLGGWFSLKRIFRCNPWSAGGLDEVP